jgi:hypothetical protein
MIVLKRTYFQNSNMLYLSCHFVTIGVKMNVWKEYVAMMQEYEYEFAQFIYYTPGYLDKEGHIWPVRAGRSIAKPNYRVGPKRIECYSLHFVHEGMIRIEFDGKRMELQKDDMFCLFPGRTCYYYMLPSDSPLQMSWLALDGDRVKPLLALAGVAPERPFGKKLISPQVKESTERVIQALAGVERWNPAAYLRAACRTNPGYGSQPFGRAFRVDS